MITTKKFRIIPLLVFVAMLSFSVRLADVAGGIRALSGQARAESEKKHESDSKVDKKEDVAEGQQGESGDALVFSDEEGDEDEGDDGIEWRDPGDEDPNYTSIRMELFDDLSARREIQEKRERDLVTREALLKAAEQELDRKYQELSQLKQEIEHLLEKQSEEEKARINSLVKIYEGMKPKDAARIFDTLDLDVLMAVMSRMSERKLSPVLASMNPERARTITIMLAEQKQLPAMPASN